MNQLLEFLKKADVPETRRDLSKPENVRWLIRNLGIRNRNLPGFSDAFDELIKLTN